MRFWKGLVSYEQPCRPCRGPIHTHTHTHTLHTDTDTHTHTHTHTHTPLRCMVAEASQPVTLTDDSPAVLFTHYMDNTKLAFCNIPCHTHSYVRLFVEKLQKTFSTGSLAHGNLRASFYTGANVL